METHCFPFSLTAPPNNFFSHTVLGEYESSPILIDEWFW